MPQSTTVLAVLDWELSTLGDPLSDLAYLCMPYHFASSPGDRAGFPSFKGGVVPEGVPTERELRAAYFRHRGMADPYAAGGEGGGGAVAPWGFYLVLSMFRMAAILQVRILYCFVPKGCWVLVLFSCLRRPVALV